VMQGLGSSAAKRMSVPRMRLGTALVGMVVACTSIQAVAMEPLYPAVTKEALPGEWAGYWRGKPIGDIELISMELDQSLRGTLARTSADGYSLVYEIDRVILESGKITVRAHDRARPSVEAVLEASGGVFGNDGWLDATLTDKRNDHLVFQVRLEKTPDRLLAKIARMLRSVRAARKGGR
jgi:hypothetical protein